MPLERFTFWIDRTTPDELDRLARAVDRDRNSLIDDAIDAYLDVQGWQVEPIRHGLRQADTGPVACDEE